MKAETLIHNDVLQRMRDDVADAAFAASGFRENNRESGGMPPMTVEILWIARCDEDGRIAEVGTAARGSAEMVPALFPHMARGDAVIHNHPGGDLRPSRADLNIASRLGNAGIGFIIIDDECSNVNVVAAPLARTETVALDIDDLADVLEPGGALSRWMDDYEPRYEQVDLLRMVASSFNAAHPVIAEAGTGVGKSFAYLIPAIRWAADNSDERVVISTATIALQQQLMEKDIPMAMKLLNVELPTALVKGRGNYLCLKRLDEAFDGDELFSSGDGLAGIRDWAQNTRTGSRSELPFRPEEGDWARVRCEADACPGAFCPKYEACFLMKARRRAADASIMVANHHLLFSDLAARRGGGEQDETFVLPAYRRIIFDEAHHAESSATSLFTMTVSLPGLNRVFNRLVIRKGRGPAGLAARLAAALPGDVDVYLGELPGRIDDARGRAETLDALSRDLLGGSSQLRLAGEETELEKTRLIIPITNLGRSLAEVVNILADGRKKLEDLPPEPETEGLAVELQQSLAVLQEAIGICDSFANRDENGEWVFWIESRRRADGSEWMEFHKSPLTVSDLMKEAVWEPFDTVIGVSATLAVGNRFDHWKSRVGALHLDSETSEGLFPSPFDYASRVLLGIPADGPSPEESEAWEAFLIRAVTEALEMTGGHALILFTSYETLRRTVTGVRSALAENPDSPSPMVLAQGEDERGRLLKKFREEDSSVLFATDSFWEGVDVPGDALRLVVITRLPFRPPTDPVAQARRDAIAAAGGNPFMQLTLPEAVIRFRQGFGRLMRRQDDHGAVLVLDPRIIRKQYGPLFLEALPKTSRSIREFDGVMRDLENFLY